MEDDMQKWEYCKLTGVKGDGYSYPKLIFFTTEGERRENLSAGSQERTTVAARIAQLGNDGWDMCESIVTSGSSPTIDPYHSIYFKRPVNSN